MIQLRLQILLSTYNGERYVAELIDSILYQQYENFELLIRDDGSTDNTINIINKYAENYRNIKVIKGHNLGVIRSFLKLLEHEPATKPDCYLFCDQDDIWLPNKLSNTSKHMQNSKNIDKALYCSRLKYVDKNLKPLGLSQTPTCTGFNNAVVENIAIGCTMAFGKDIRNLLLLANSDHMMMHDWWAYLIASAFGEIIYDETPNIKYRQHPNSVTAWEPGFSKLKARIKGLIKRLIQNENTGLQSLNQAILFINTYEETPDNCIEIVNQLVKLRDQNQLLNRIKYILNPKVVRTNKVENLLLKPLIFFGWH